MENYLQLCRHSLPQLATADIETVHMVVGNESCDLDSAVSALVFAYLLHETQYSTLGESVVLPLLNIDRSELRLRTELIFWFQETLQIDLNLLICRNEINLSEIKSNGKRILITLVDHNEDSIFESFGEVVEIIDHHKPSQSISRKSGLKKEIDSGVGSCSTLVAKRYLASCSERGADIQIALLLFGPIVLDTVCLSESAQRFNQQDVDVVKQLEKIMGESLTRQEVYQQLIQAKNSAANFNVGELLVKDLKIIEGVGCQNIAVSSLPGMLVKDFFNRSEVSVELEKFRSDSQYIGVVILGIENTDPTKLKRDLALYFPNRHLLKKVSEKLESPSSDLSLELISEKANLKIYHQGNVTASRKVILPLISEVASKEATVIDLVQGAKSELPKQSRSSQNKLVTHQISTADVDPDFVVNYQAETADFPEYPKHYLNETPTPTPVTGSSALNAVKKGKNDSPSSEGRFLANGKPSNGGLSPSAVQSPKNSTSSGVSLQQPPSLCYYESYFEDSFVGDFTGEVDAARIKDMEREEAASPGRWCGEANMDSMLEFGYDSFGPESLLFTGNSNDLTLQKSNHPLTPDHGPNENDFVSLSVAEPQLKDTVSSCFDENKIKTGYELTIEENHPFPEETVVQKENGEEIEKAKETETEKQEEKLEEEEEEDGKEKDRDEQTQNINDDSRPELKKEEGSEGSPPSPPSRASPPSPLSPPTFLTRNSTLTQSQRRKISPRIKLEEMLNSSDDHILSDAHSATTQYADRGNSDPNPLLEVAFLETNVKRQQSEYRDITQLSPDGKLETVRVPTQPYRNSEGILTKQGSLTKKKITVNREILDNDDLREPSFSPGGGPNSSLESETQAQNSAQVLGDLNADAKIPELTSREEAQESRRWKESCPMGMKGEVKRIDMKVIEPYKKVLSHGGYYHHYNTAQLTRNNATPAPGPAIIIFSACYLPDRSRRDYSYVMDNLFMYVLTTLHELVADDYMLIYFHNPSGGGIASNNMPTFSWLKRCYYMIDRRLRKNLKALYLVHPTFWLKTIVIMTKPFISSKFSRKVRFVGSLSELNDLVPIESTIIPPPVKQNDDEVTLKQ